jgi:hypothetical protein
MNNQEKEYYQNNQESIVAKLERLVEVCADEAQEAKRESSDSYVTLQEDRMTAEKCLTASRNGDWEKAKDIAYWCDTIIREKMPGEFWAFD